jgi:hypothetical protein
MSGRIKKHRSVFSVLSLAAFAGLAGTSSRALGVDLNSYYINAIVSTVLPTSKTLALGVNATQVSLDPTAPTVTVPIGDYFSFGVAAVLTNNANPLGGLATSDGQGGTIVQPTNLGLVNLGYRVTNVSFNDADGSLLSPVLNGARVFPGLYNSTAVIGGKGIGSTAPSGYPITQGDPGDVQPSSAAVSTIFQIYQQSSPGAVSPTPAGMAVLQEFGSATGGASQAVTAFDTLGYQALKNGTVDLRPEVDPGTVLYWGETNPGTSSTPAAYRARFFSSSDTIHSLPFLTVVTGEPTPPHSILSFGVTSDAAHGPQITNGTSSYQGSFSGGGNILTVSRGSGHYDIAQVTGIKSDVLQYDAPFNASMPGTPLGNVEANGFNPSSNPELWGLDILVNGTQATSNQIATLIADINSVGGGLQSGLSASPTLANDPFASSYNLFVTANGAITGNGNNFLGFDLSGSNDSNLLYYTVSAVAATGLGVAVPEPMSFGMLALGGVGLLLRRRNKGRSVHCV